MRLILRVPGVLLITLMIWVPSGWSNEKLLQKLEFGSSYSVVPEGEATDRIHVVVTVKNMTDGPLWFSGRLAFTVTYVPTLATISRVADERRGIVIGSMRRRRPFHRRCGEIPSVPGPPSTLADRWINVEDWTVNLDPGEALTDSLFLLAPRSYYLDYPGAIEIQGVFQLFDEWDVDPLTRWKRFEPDELHVWIPYGN